MNTDKLWAVHRAIVQETTEGDGYWWECVRDTDNGEEVFVTRCFGLHRDSPFYAQDVYVPTEVEGTRNFVAIVQQRIENIRWAYQRAVEAHDGIGQWP